MLIEYFIFIAMYVLAGVSYTEKSYIIEQMGVDASEIMSALYEEDWQVSTPVSNSLALALVVVVFWPVFSLFALGWRVKNWIAGFRRG
jgi:hypothetical protein